MTYVFPVYDCYSLPLAKHLQDEGNEVIIGMLASRNQMMIPGVKDDQKPEDRKQRLSNYDGLLKKQSLPDMIHRLSMVRPEGRDNYFFFFDFNDLYKISEQILRMGFRKGLFPTERYYRLEKERKLSKKFAIENYPDVKVAEAFDFKSVADGIKKIRESDQIFCLKSNGNEGKTIVPATDEIDIAQDQLIDALQKGKKQYEKGGFMLEEKIPDCLEVTPIMVFWDGVPVYSIAEFENKQYGAGNIGAQKGGNQVVSIRTELDAEINRIAFPEVIYNMAEQQPGLSIYDAGLLYDGSDFWFTEFCAMRYGWDGIFSEIVMADKGTPFVTEYFESIMRGESPLVNKCGAAVRLFNYEGDYEDTKDPLGDEVMTWDDEIENNLFLYSAKKRGNEIVDTEDRDFVAAVTGAGDTVESAVKAAYDRVDKFHFDKLYFRPMFDFLSKDYKDSIPNRIKAVEQFL